MKKSKSRFQNPHGGGYRPHTQVHKAKNKYDRKTSKTDVEDVSLDNLTQDELDYLGSLYPEDEVINNLINRTQ